MEIDTVHKLRIATIWVVIMLFFFQSCQKEPSNSEAGIMIRVENQLDVRIDTLQMIVITSEGNDSLVFADVNAQQTSQAVSLKQAKYFFKEEGDIFLISEGRFVIQGITYPLSNCFCDPSLQEGQLPEGEYLIRVLEIDPFRQTVNYRIMEN